MATPIFKEGSIQLHLIGDSRVEEILRTGFNRAEGLVKPSDLLAAAIDSREAIVLATLSKALQPGASPTDVSEVIDIYHPRRSEPNMTFAGQRSEFSSEALAALDQFGDKLDDETRQANIVLQLFLACLLHHLDNEDKSYLTALDPDQGAALFHLQIQTALEPLPSLFDSKTQNQSLRSEEFTEGAWTVMRYAADRAAELGYTSVLTPHCFLALLSETEGVAEHLVRLQAQPEIGPGKVADVVAEIFRLADRKTEKIGLDRQSIGESTSAMLRNAQKIARLWESEQIDSPHLLSALLQDIPGRLASALQRSPLNLDLSKLKEHLDQYLRESHTHKRREVAFRLPEGLLPSEDLTYRAHTEELLPAVPTVQNRGELNPLTDPYDLMTRALYRQVNNHILVTGLRGVGKTTLIWELARRAAAGEIAFLKRKRFLWVNCQDVAPDESKDKLSAILSHVAGRTDFILYLDGLGPLLRAESGSNNKIMLRAALKESRIHLVAVMSNSDFEDLISGDPDFLEFFTRISVEEPDEELSKAILRQIKNKFEETYGVTIQDIAIDRAVVLSASYILNERLPSKAIKILRRACENLNYARTQRGDPQESVLAKDVVRVVAEISGVPEETLIGMAKKADYASDLATQVVGQKEAVEAVARELGLIKAGLNSPGKPASVMFFAGLTGVGKTELAKELAKLYSASKRLQVYTMANYSESHTVSGIIGVPPGYVGHEQGGRLINDLNADPYCVVLLDEAEKAHPDIWKPFLNLFDEGWIVDQRGVKAFADRAIFILTSNAGHEKITEGVVKGKELDVIAADVKQELLTKTYRNTGLPVFTPEFLARIKHIVVFRPLAKEAMEGICRKLVEQMKKSWRQKRGKEIIVPEELIEYIAEHSHQKNQDSGGNEGGRIVSKLISDLIESTIQGEATRDEEGYRHAKEIELLFLGTGIGLPYTPGQRTPPKVKVVFRQDRAIDANEELAQAAEAAQRLLQVNHSSLVAFQQALDNLKQTLVRWQPKYDPTTFENRKEEWLKRLAQAHADLVTGQQAEQQVLNVVGDIQYLRQK